MAKKKPLSTQQRYVLEYVSNLNESVSEGSEKALRDILEIGCRKVRMGNKVVKVVEWAVKNESVVVIVNGIVSRYSYPLHKNLYRRFVDFEVLDDCGYLDRWANGEEYVVDGKRYGVMDDVVWAGGKRYLSADERVGFGSFREFLEKQGTYTQNKCII